jgi:thiosulfate reductase cytochrome b subunit
LRPRGSRLAAFEAFVGLDIRQAGTCVSSFVKTSSKRVYRHPLAVRVTHWVSALALIVLAMSGMQIFNAHPALYASDASDFNHPVFSIRSEQAPDGRETGYVQLGPWRVNTTGVFGVGPDGEGGVTSRAFPSWATIPYYQDLADGRRWHIFFAWILVLCGAVYAWWALSLWPSRTDLRDLPRTLRDHLIPWKVAASAKLNPLQKISYFGIVFVVVPVVVLSGLALSPAIDAHFHWLPEMFGGRQFARIWHFAGMLALMLFFVIHLLMVAVTGLVNNLRSMITGWLTVKGT